MKKTCLLTIIDARVSSQKSPKVKRLTTSIEVEHDIELSSKKMRIALLPMQEVKLKDRPSFSSYPVSDREPNPSIHPRKNPHPRKAFLKLHASYELLNNDSNNSSPMLNCYCAFPDCNSD